MCVCVVSSGEVTGLEIRGVKSYLFVAITPRSSLIRNVCACYGLILGSVRKLFVSDSESNHITAQINIYN